MTSAELRQLGTRLYGERWQTALARDLGVAPRTVRRYAAGDRKISPPVQLAVRLMVERAQDRAERKAGRPARSHAADQDHGGQ